MKLLKIITVSAVSFSLLGLSACAGNQTSSPAQTQQSSSGSSQQAGTSTDKGSSGNTNSGSTSQGSGSNQSGSSAKSSTSSGSSGQSGTGSSQTGSGQSGSSQQGSSSGGTTSKSSNSSNTGTTSTQSTGSSQGQGSAASNSSSSATAQQPTNAPKTTDQAVSFTKNMLSTKVPIMLPKIVPMEKGYYLTATTVSQPWYYKAAFYETKQPAPINSAQAKAGTLIASVEGTEYTDPAHAQASISGYQQVNVSRAPVVDDLGHGIKASEEGAVGHNYIMWNEGRWLVRIDSPNDSAYMNKTYPDSKQLAKKIVTFLNRYFLPAPQDIGVITVNNWDHNSQTTVQWQDHQMTYKVTSSDPFNALATAVHMQVMKK